MNGSLSPPCKLSIPLDRHCVSPQVHVLAVFRLRSETRPSYCSKPLVSSPFNKRQARSQSAAVSIFSRSYFHVVIFPYYPCLQSCFGRLRWKRTIQSVWCAIFSLMFPALIRHVRATRTNVLEISVSTVPPTNERRQLLWEQHLGCVFRG